MLVIPPVPTQHLRDTLAAEPTRPITERCTAVPHHPGDIQDVLLCAAALGGPSARNQP